jgi:hypothetical protein
LLVCTVARPATSQPMAETFHGSEAFRDFRLAGYEMLDEKRVDLDSDGLKDSLVVERSAGGIGLSAWQADDKGDYLLLSREPPIEADSLKKFEIIELDPTSRAVLLDICEESPDEADHGLRLFVLGPKGTRKLIETRYVVTHPEEEAGRPSRRVVDLGGISPGLKINPRGSGWPEILVRHDPKLVFLAGRSDRKTWFIIGIRERVFAAKGADYIEREDRYIDFLTRVAPVNLTATSRLPSSTSAWDVKSVTDGKLSTGWVEGQPGSGEAQSVTLSFSKEEPVRLVRLVPGCASSKEDWEARNRVSRFSIMFENGVMVPIERGNSSKLDPRIEAFGDFSLPGLDFGMQTMVFFREPVRSGWVKITIEGVERGTSAENETCISEISAHRALVDAAK